MRDDQIRFRHSRTSVENQIQVERPCGTRPGTLASAFPLDGQERVEKGASRQHGLPHHHPIQEMRLLTDTHGSGLTQRRSADVGENGGQAIDRKREVGVAIAQVAAKGDRHRGRSYSTQRAPSTTPE